MAPCSPELIPAGHIWEAVREDSFANTVPTGFDEVENTLLRRLGQVDLDSLSERGRFNYLCAHTLIGREYGQPAVAAADAW